MIIMNEPKALDFIIRGRFSDGVKYNFTHEHHLVNALEYYARTHATESATEKPNKARLQRLKNYHAELYKRLITIITNFQIL